MVELLLLIRSLEMDLIDLLALAYLVLVDLTLKLLLSWTHPLMKRNKIASMNLWGNRNRADEIIVVFITFCDTNWFSRLNSRFSSSAFLSASSNA